MFYRFLLLPILLTFFFAPGFGTVLANDAEYIESKLVLADALVKTGISEMGAGRSFEEVRVLIADCESILVSGSLTGEQHLQFQKEFQAIREDLEVLEELYEERFYGVFPLTRLVVPTLLEDEGLAISEQLFHPAEIAAAIKAANSIGEQLMEYRHPQVIIRSSAQDRRLENIVAEVLMRKSTSTTHTRRKIVNILDDGQLQAFDDGRLSVDLVHAIFEKLHAGNLVILSLSRFDRVAGGVSVIIKGGYYTPGESVQGGPVDATLVIRMEDFIFGGFARDRRAMFRPILVANLALLLFSLAWAAKIRWNKSNPLSIGVRLVVGAVLFLYGRLFMILTILIMRHYIPEEVALMTAAWWWPALIGMLGIIGVGQVAWFGQARLMAAVPSCRVMRAVGTIFGITALGATSYFITPLLLLDEMAGFSSLVPFLIAALTLALVFGLAARTGPPVPRYFMVFPFLASFATGTALFMASPVRLWQSAGLALSIALVAYVRHKVAVAIGREEHEPNEKEAADKDREQLVKSRKKLKRDKHNHI